MNDDNFSWVTSKPMRIRRSAGQGYREDRDDSLESIMSPADGDDDGTDRDVGADGQIDSAGNDDDGRAERGGADDGGVQHDNLEILERSGNFWPED